MKFMLMMQGSQKGWESMSTWSQDDFNGEDFGISLSNLEPPAYVAGAAIAVIIALLASLAPARRAASVQPMVAMRSE